MNYFGMFFTFMMPGVLIGIMAAAVLREYIQTKLRQEAKRRLRIVRERQLAELRAAQNVQLFVHDIEAASQRILSRETSGSSAA